MRLLLRLFHSALYLVLRAYFCYLFLHFVIILLTLLALGHIGHRAMYFTEQLFDRCFDIRFGPIVDSFAAAMEVGSMRGTSGLVDPMVES